LRVASNGETVAVGMCVRLAGYLAMGPIT
jgi:hypothetical protein